MDLLASFGVGGIAGALNMIVKMVGSMKQNELQRDKDYLEIAKMQMDLWERRMQIISGNRLLLISEVFARAWFMVVPTLILAIITWYAATHPETVLWFPDENNDNGFSILGIEIFSWKGAVKWSQLQGTVILPIWFTMLGAAVSMHVSDRMFNRR